MDPCFIKQIRYENDPQKRDEYITQARDLTDELDYLEKVNINGSVVYRRKIANEKVRRTD